MDRKMIKERKGRERKRDKSLKHVHIRKAVADYQSSQTVGGRRPAVSFLKEQGGGGVLRC